MWDIIRDSFIGTKECPGWVFWGKHSFIFVSTKEMTFGTGEKGTSTSVEFNM